MMVPSEQARQQRPRRKEHIMSAKAVSTLNDFLRTYNRGGERALEFEIDLASPASLTEFQVFYNVHSTDNIVSFVVNEAMIRELEEAEELRLNAEEDAFLAEEWTPPPASAFIVSNEEAARLQAGKSDEPSEYQQFTASQWREYPSEDEVPVEVALYKMRLNDGGEVVMCEYHVRSTPLSEGSVIAGNMGQPHECELCAMEAADLDSERRAGA